jgi:ABC-type transporter Mla maintaining outer membrane lipid asymmetry ATPase subunit MlaF
MQIKNLTMSFGTQVLFENVNLNCEQNKVYGEIDKVQKQSKY